MEDQVRCPECGRHFGSRETFQEHVEIDHSGSVEPQESGFELRDRVFSRLDRSFALGLLVGLLIASAGFAGYSYWSSLDHRVDVPVTVVTCDNCSYDRFETATERLFDAEWNEVSYTSDRGQQLIEKYNINYVPAFIFDARLEKAENFYRVESVLVKFDDAYVIPDSGPRTAQRLSSGKQLQR